MNRTRSMTTGILALAIVGVASAQATSFNGFHLEPRVFNDFPDSTLVETGNFATRTVNISDVGDNRASGGGANRHEFHISNDGGATAYGLSGPDDFFNFTMSVDLTSTSTGSRKEAGIILTTGAPTQLDSQFIITSNSGNAGEVAVFGGAANFYSFTTTNNVRYTEGTTVTLGLRYFKDTDGLYKFQYQYNNIFSPAFALNNPPQFTGATGLNAGTQIGGYVQIPGDNSGATNGATAIFSNINVTAVPEPATIAALGLGLIAVVRRRKKA